MPRQGLYARTHWPLIERKGNGEGATTASAAVEPRTAITTTIVGVPARICGGPPPSLPSPAISPAKVPAIGRRLRPPPPYLLTSDPGWPVLLDRGRGGDSRRAGRGSSHLLAEAHFNLPTIMHTEQLVPYPCTRVPSGPNCCPPEIRTGALSLQISC